jgi:hypothetical protein
MLFAQNSTTTSDLEEEILFHISELRYHKENYEAALREAEYHLQKSNYHDLLISELTSSLYEVVHA